MKRVYSIDWLSLWCKGFTWNNLNNNDINPCRDNDIAGYVLGAAPYEDPVKNSKFGNREIKNDRSLFDNLHWGYKKEAHGTRQFANIVNVSLEGDEFASVCYKPYSPLFDADDVMIKFANRILYLPDCWNLIDRFLIDHKCVVKNISRLDLCCDFNSFYKYPCAQLISDFLGSKIRHIGRGNGSAHFNHFAKKIGTSSQSNVIYTGLTFGNHDSDAHIYLYNKSYELMCVKDKPYIRDSWSAAGLDITRDVWRLEVSIKSKGLKFKDKKTMEDVEILPKNIHGNGDVITLFHTFTDKLFRFVKNDHAISNISREPIVDLWGENVEAMDRYVVRPITGSTRTERILIRQLHQLADVYRDPRVKKWGDQALKMAQDLAQGTDLNDWYHKRRLEWDSPLHK